jgi:RHH-type proline utilization regulon transcriptional repressor/proline dehydrogenase/delta 1-pyrroline-5-carboxylate dehydrogenase
VRRLLENGANSSFVNQIVDESVPIDTLLADPFEQARAAKCLPHPRIPLPLDLFGDGRKNSAGLDLANEDVLRALSVELGTARHYLAAPLIDGARHSRRRWREQRDQPGAVGRYRRPGDGSDGHRRRHRAAGGHPRFPGLGRHGRQGARADIVAKVGDLFEQHMGELMALAVREAGKSLPNAIAEIREAVDFLRYYAEEAREARRSARAGCGDVHQPVELPAGHLHGPGRRGAGRRQRGAGQAGRADPLDRAPRRAAVP